MDGVEDRTRKDAQAVDITVAVALGAIVATLPVLAVWLVAMANRGGGDWSAAKHAVHVGALLAGAAVTVWWLVRSPRP